jgi:serine/threonine protein kinase
MFLSWAGQPLFDGLYQASKADVIAAVTAMFKAVRGQRVLHRDAEPGNILYDTNSDKLMAVDFERAEFRCRQPLGSIDSNGRSRKRKRATSLKQEKDVFAQELESVVEAVLRCVAH